MRRPLRAPRPGLAPSAASAKVPFQIVLGVATSLSTTTCTLQIGWPLSRALAWSLPARREARLPGQPSFLGIQVMELARDIFPGPFLHARPQPPSPPARNTISPVSPILKICLQHAPRGWAEPGELRHCPPGHKHHKGAGPYNSYTVQTDSRSGFLLPCACRAAWSSSPPLSLDLTGSRTIVATHILFPET